MSGYFYRNHPQTCDPEDFWGQVKRTVNGRPVPQEQIDMIVAAVCSGLQLGAEDVLLDLCCGNGALTTYFFQRCAGGLGVDYSEYLINIARTNFARRTPDEFQLDDSLKFASDYARPERFTKALCYGALMFFTVQDAAHLLAALRRRFRSLARLFIGNLPDRDRMHDFFRQGEYRPGIENDPTSPTGVWYTAGEFTRMAEDAGWSVEIQHMPESFYAAHYRFDALLVAKQTK